MVYTDPVAILNPDPDLNHASYKKKFECFISLLNCKQLLSIFRIRLKIRKHISRSGLKQKKVLDPDPHHCKIAERKNKCELVGGQVLVPAVHQLLPKGLADDKRSESEMFTRLEGSLEQKELPPK